MRMPQDTDSESEQSAPELVEDNDNRLSDDEEFPISEDEDEDIEENDEGEEIEENDEDEDMEENDDDEEPSKTGWADSMAKILKSDKTGVLSKAKKIEDIAKKKEKKSYTFEIDGAEEDESEKKPDQSALERALAKKKYREKRENKFRVFNLRLKPSVLDLDRERTFKKIATRGVVQLFNAVKTQQSDLSRKLQSTKLESKREEIIRSSENKKNFLDNLMSGPRARSELVDQAIKKEKKYESSEESEEEGKSSWSALRNDFMTGKKVGWDKDDSEDDDEPEDMESESD